MYRQALTTTTLLVCVGWAPAQKGWPRGGEGANDAVQSSPLVLDIDGDGKSEVFMTGFDDLLRGYRHDGTTLPNFPVILGFADGTISSITAADLLGDDTPFLVVAGDDPSSRNASVRHVNALTGVVGSITLPSASTASGKATVCAIDCQQFVGGLPHPAEELLLRDGLGRLHLIHRDAGGSFINRYVTGGQLETTSSQLQQDLSGSQPITPSVSALRLSGFETLIVVSSTDGGIHHWVATSSPAVDWNLGPRQTILPAGSGRFLASPILLDLHGDGGVEILAARSDGMVGIWDYLGGGNPIAGWPRETGQAIYSSPACADINGDGVPDIVVGTDQGSVFAWSGDGNPLPGWPVQTGGAIFGSPVIADIAAPAGLEVVVGGTDGRLHAWSASGEPLPGWPKRLNTPIYATVTVADLHESLKYSIVMAAFDGRLFCFDLDHRYDATLGGWFTFRGNTGRQGSLTGGLQ